MSDEIAEVLTALARKRTHYRLEFYEPYPKQREFHSIAGFETPDRIGSQRALIAGNQVGKTLCGGAETAYHACGRYPEWWTGIRYSKPPKILCGGVTNETTRDVVQAELCGDPGNDKALGTGWLPVDCIGQTTRKPGVPNAFDNVQVKHHTNGVYDGMSTISFRAYEQGYKKHMGIRIDFGWLDEEPPSDVFSQYIRGTFATNGFLILTFTPEMGVTDVLHQFMSAPRQGQAVVHMTWDDAKHFDDPDYRAQKMAEIPEHERELRTKGIPVMGSGLVFPVQDEQITCEPFEIPSFWPRIIGMDFGWDHPFAAVAMAWDRETDTTYVYKTFRESKCRIPIGASEVKRMGGSWIPCAWPHDGLQKDKQSGRPMAELYRDEGCNMLIQMFSNPPAPGQHEGQGGQGVEVGLHAMREAMEGNRFKVFATESDWFEERRVYHRRDGSVVKLRDDLMSASRYAYQSRRFADVQIVPKQHHAARGMSNWTQ